MGMDGLVPTFSVNGDNGNGNGNGWNDAIGAFAGALFGSWWGNGWVGGNGGGNRGGNGGCSCGGGAPSVVIAGNPGGGSTAELDALTGIQAGINGLGLQVLNGQNTANLANCQSTASIIANNTAAANQLNSALTQGFAGLNTTLVTGDQSIQNSLCQGFNGLNTAVLVSSKDNALANCQSTNAITSAINDCCCTMQRTTMAEGSATRQLMDRYAYENLQTQLCDAKSKIASLESQTFTANALAQLGNQLRQEMNANALNIIGHMAVIPRPTTAAAS